MPPLMKERIQILRNFFSATEEPIDKMKFALQNVKLAWKRKIKEDRELRNALAEVQEELKMSYNCVDFCAC